MLAKFKSHVQNYGLLFVQAKKIPQEMCVFIYTHMFPQYKYIIYSMIFLFNFNIYQLICKTYVYVCVFLALG